MKFSTILKLNLLTAGLLASVFFISTPASAQIFGGSTGNTLLGAGIGAGLGGVLGSNLAGTGVQQEGTAIGAVLGGIAGAAVVNRGAHQANNRRSSRYGGFIPGYGPGYGYEYSKRASVPYSTFGGSYVSATNYGGGYSGQFAQPPFIQTQFIQTQFIQAPFIQAPFIQPLSFQGLQYVQGLNIVQNYTIPYITNQVVYPPVLPQITRPIYAPVLAPTLPVINAYCYKGSDKRYDGFGRMIRANPGDSKTCLLKAYEGR